MAEAAEESSKENFLSGGPDGKKFVEKNRGSSRDIRDIGLSCLERCLLPLAPCSAWPGLYFFQAEEPSKEKHRSGGVGRTKISEFG